MRCVAIVCRGLFRMKLENWSIHHDECKPCADLSLLARTLADSSLSLFLLCRFVSITRNRLCVCLDEGKMW